MASAGRILIMPKGNFDSSVTYEMLDLVYHNGTAWIAKKPVVGIEPNDVNSEHWHKLCESVDLTEIEGRIAALENQMVNATSLVDELDQTVSGFPNLQIKRGSYIGQGIYGEDVAKSINFGFVPKAVFISTKNPAYQCGTVIWLHGMTEMIMRPINSNDSVTLYFDQEGQNLKWYQLDSAALHLNTSGETYFWVAIG